ncbi:MAG: hypothetical protein K2J37_00675 [Ruminococcus sp.]|nr:hypothetical protein [Ruminococcus sp.]MDE6785030.1 hypothetical protein [Ruminococcus sp.]
MKRKKRFSVLKLFFTIICVTSIIVSAAVNLLFADGRTPELFGRYIYLVGEDNPMTGDINTGSALIAMDASEITIATGDIVLCYPADAPDKLSLRSVSFIAASDDSSESYYTKDSFHEDNADSISKDRIVAVCTGYPESLELGRFIDFARSFNGRVVMMGIAALFLLLFIVSAFARSRSDEEEEEYDFYDYEEDDGKKKKNQNQKGSMPLYEPAAEAAQNPELERKKMSIAENFKQKQVNPDSPYQRERERERTMQFTAPRPGSSLSSTMSFTSTGSAESSFVARNRDNQKSSPAPTADALREEMLRKTAAAERTGVYNIRKPSSEPVSDNTGIITAAQIAELRGGSAVPRQHNAPEPVKPAVKTVSSPVSQKSSSPDISDILRQTGSPRSTKSPSEMSVDELLKMIEDEKSKL